MKKAERNFPYLEINEEAREVWYTGYILPLTRGEYDVLKAVLESRDYCDKNRIREIIESERLSSNQISELSIPIHISSINKKSMAIGERKIITYKKNIKYRWKYSYYMQRM